MQTVTSHDAPHGVRQVEIGPERDGQRIDNALVTMLKGVPKSMIYRLLRTGQVRVNGKRAKPDYRVATGDAVRIPPVRMGEPVDPGAPPEGESARVEAAILAENRDFIVIDKPSGVASHGGSGVSFGAIELMRAARPNETLELVHRLDRDTSGVLVLAKRRSALTALQAEIRAGRVEKRYLALLAGALPQGRLPVDAPLLKSVLQGGERMVRVDEAGKASRSRFAEVERFGDATLAEVAIETGRTHQIRVHSAHIGHPVAGDDKYGDKAFNAAMRKAGLKRLFLHAARFEFSIGEGSYAFSAPLPAELKAVLDALSGGSPPREANVRRDDSEPRARVRTAPSHRERRDGDDRGRERNAPPSRGRAPAKRGARDDETRRPGKRAGAAPSRARVRAHLHQWLRPTPRGWRPECKGPVRCKA